jgi:hypothetical protein
VIFLDSFVKYGEELDCVQVNQVNVTSNETVKNNDLTFPCDPKFSLRLDLEFNMGCISKVKSCMPAQTCVQNADRYFTDCKREYHCAYFKGIQFRFTGKSGLC